MKRNTSSSIAPFFILLACGCGSANETERDRDTDFTFEELSAIQNVLARRGFDVQDLRFLEGRVVVEGDISFDARALLAEATQSVDKGYWIANGWVSQNVWLRNHPTQPVSTAWAWAFLAAANNWTAQTNVNFYYDGQNPPNATITIRKANLGLGWEPTIALGDYPDPIPGAPGFSYVGTTITVNAGYNSPPSCPGSTDQTVEGLPANQKIKTAAHELGHNLGLGHPGEFSHLPGTAQASSNYNSVMWEGCVGGKVVSSLSSDDIASAALIFPNP